MAVLLCFTTFTSCSKDDETPADGSDGQPEVEICVFFAPGELGDLGYADRLLSGLHQFQKELDTGDRDRILVRYVSSSDTAVVRSELHHWGSQKTNPFTRKPYERRLLVLTDAVLLPMFEATQLGPTDEVLVINASNATFERTPHFSELGQRLHLLSISAAEAAKKFCEMVDRSEVMGPDTQKQLWLLQQLVDIHDMADSIGIVLEERMANKPASLLFTIPKYTFEGASLTLSDAYKQAHFFPFNVSTDSYTCYIVCGWGGLNVALSSLIVTQGLGSTQATFLDTDYVSMKGVCHTIVRHYDRALQGWLQRWLSSPAATMPAREWHGAWDGYVTDDL